MSDGTCLVMSNLPFHSKSHEVESTMVSFSDLDEFAKYLAATGELTDNSKDRKRKSDGTKVEDKRPKNDTIGDYKQGKGLQARRIAVLKHLDIPFDTDNRGEPKNWNRETLITYGPGVAECYGFINHTFKRWVIDKWLDMGYTVSDIYGTVSMNPDRFGRKVVWLVPTPKGFQFVWCAEPLNIKGEDYYVG